MKLPDTMKKMGGGKLAFALLALFPFASGAATYYASPDHGDFTLLPNSPCRNAGMLEEWMEGATDLAGGPRVSGRGVDMGCYELFAPSGLNIIVR